MKGGEEEEARPWHSPIPCRPTSCTGRDLEPSEPALRRAALGQSPKCTGPRTVTPKRSTVQIQYLDAWRHAELSRHLKPNPTRLTPLNTTTTHPQTSCSRIWSRVDSLLDVLDKSFQLRLIHDCRGENGPRRRLGT